MSLSSSSLASPPNYRFILDDSTSATLTLPDGRKLGYAQYGDPKGQPIFYMHGFPAARVEGAGLGDVASKVGARIIAVDRPGLGWSSPNKNASLLSHAKDVEHLGEHLKLERYGVLGISGGGPYALACAKALPSDKLRAVSLVCGLGSPDMTYRGMNVMSWMGWTFGQRFLPGLCRWWFGREISARLDLSREERLQTMHQQYEKAKSKTDPKDALVFGDPDWMYMHIRRGEEVYRQGMDSFSQDFRLLNSDFGFRIEDIRKDLPFKIWHGHFDTFVPLQHAQKVAQRLGPNADLTITEDTHASIWAVKKEEYLRLLVDAVKTG